MPEQKEEEPPWVVYPEHELGEGFFKQGEGNTFMAYTWEPYWASLNEEQQEAYLKRWNVPDSWYRLRFDKEFQHILKTYRDGLPPLPPSSSEGIGDGYGARKYLRMLKDFLGMRKAKP